MGLAAIRRPGWLALPRRPCRLDRVGEGGKLVFEDVIQLGQRIMHSRCSQALREPDLLSCKVKQLRNAAFVVARQSERVGNRTLNWHVKRDSDDSAVGKEAK